MASSRHRFSVRKSSVLIGAFSFHREFGDGLTDIAIVVHDLATR
jgi:hypothetical protein